MCTSKINKDSFTCASSIVSTPTSLSAKLSVPQLLLNHALDLQRSISFITPSISSVFFFFGLLNLGVLQFLQRKRKPSLLSKHNQALDKHIQNLTLATRIILWVSTAISLAAVHSAHSILTALQVSTSPKYGTVEGGRIVRGNSIEAMLWSTFALSMVFNTIMQLTTTPSRPHRGRKSTPLPFTKSDIGDREDREESIRKITTATAQRLAMIGTQNLSQQSVATADTKVSTTTNALAPSPLNPDFIALNSPGLQPPLATLQRRPTNPKQKPSPLSLAPPNQQQTPLSFLDPSPRQKQHPTPSTRRIEVRIPTEHDLGRFGQISPGLQGILSRDGRATSSIYSRPATSPRVAEKNAWL